MQKKKFFLLSTFFFSFSRRFSDRQQHESRSSSPQRTIANELKQLFDQRVVNDELIDLKTQIALLQSSNEPEP